jgi:hypothetical protein
MRSNKRAAQVPDYEVGYGRPPRHHQFKKGQPSPNPKGRPRGQKTVDLRSVLNELVPIKIRGRNQSVPFLVAFLQLVKDRAIKGDFKSSQLLVMIAKHFGMLDVPEIEDDFEFTLRIGRDPPPEIQRKLKENE